MIVRMLSATASGSNTLFQSGRKSDRFACPTAFLAASENCAPVRWPARDRLAEARSPAPAPCIRAQTMCCFASILPE